MSLTLRLIQTALKLRYIRNRVFWFRYILGLMYFPVVVNLGEVPVI